MNATTLIPPPADPAPITPGAYLRLRRQAAGVSIDRVASVLLPIVEATPTLPARHVLSILIKQLVELEDDHIHVTRAISGLLANVFPLDVSVYDALVARHFGADVPLPNICRVCACSFHDPCIGGDSGDVCGWASGAADLCTFCAAPRPVEPAPLSPAPLGGSSGAA